MAVCTGLGWDADPSRTERKGVLLAGGGATTVTKDPLCEAPNPKRFTKGPLMSWCFIPCTMPSPICSWDRIQHEGPSQQRFIWLYLPNLPKVCWKGFYGLMKPGFDFLTSISKCVVIPKMRVWQHHALSSEKFLIPVQTWIQLCI